MKTSDQTEKLWPAMLAARKDMKAAHKGKKNDHFKYSYANEEAWHDAVQPPLQANDLFLSFSADTSTRTGTLTTIHGSARITHISGQWIEICGVGEGEDKNDKGAYKAQTGLKKYLYALAFALPTTDDVEDPAHDKKRAADEMKAEIVAATPAATNAEVNGALIAAGHEPQHNPEARAKAKALFEKAKLIDYSDANRIKRQWGTDYERMAEELDLFISGAPKKA